MRIVVEPACYVWGASAPVTADYPPQAFVDGVLWLQNFFAWNEHCRVPMTADLRAAVGRLFPYEHLASAGRIAAAQELIGIIVRVLDRVCAVPDIEYQALTPAAAIAGLTRVGVYVDDDVWLSWSDLLTHCVALAVHEAVPLHALAAQIESCVSPEMVEASRRGDNPNWLRLGVDPVPHGTVEPGAMDVMTGRWRQCARPVVWEDSGHQPPVAIKRLIARVVDDCKGVIVRFGSTYYNPSLPLRCGVSACGTDGERVSQLECVASDGTATVRGIFRTTAITAAEQAAALSFVTRRLRTRCAELGLTFEC